MEPTHPLNGEPDGNLRQRRKHGYEAFRPEIQACVPITARRILELGCSTGLLGEAIKARQDAFVLGVEIDAEYAAEAEGRIDRVILSDVEAFIDTAQGQAESFDCVVAADVLEHLYDPWRALAGVARLLCANGSVIVSVPNVLFWPHFRRLVLGGRWPRDDDGIFDRTHLRWFTERDAVELVEQAGFAIRDVEPRYWSEGRVLLRRRMLTHTPLRRFQAAQYVIHGVLPPG